MIQKSRLFLIVGIGMFLMLYFFFFSQKGIMVHGEFLQRQNNGIVEEYRGQVQGYDTGIVLDRSDVNNCKIRYQWKDVVKNYFLELQPSESWLQGIVIREKDKVLFDGQYNPDKNETFFRLYQDDGMPYMENMITVTVNGKQEPADSLDVYQLTSLYAGAETVRGNGAYAAGGIILLLFWLVDILFPKFFFLLSHALSVRDPEPSDFYLMIQRIEWVLMPVIAVVLLLMGLFTR